MFSVDSLGGLSVCCKWAHAYRLH